ncbi:MAG TPA: hypothetical protein VK501_12655 [Baekduia sp.]|nr:hypothetical protein [Baekduia sp.]HMJ34760.1 hypothetical protein [Baekduia sp.]
MPAPVHRALALAGHPGHARRAARDHAAAGMSATLTVTAAP